MLHDGTTQGRALSVRTALRRFLRHHFPALLNLRFVTLARAGDLQQLVARLDGARVASVLLTVGADRNYAEGATACSSVASRGG